MLKCGVARYYGERRSPLWQPIREGGNVCRLEGPRLLNDCDTINVQTVTTLAVGVKASVGSIDSVQKPMEYSNIEGRIIYRFALTLS